MLIPLVFLGIGSIAAGYFFKEIFIGHNSTSYWQSSIKILKEIKHTHIPLWFLLITPILVTISIPIVYFYYIHNTEILSQFEKTNLPLYNFY